MLKMLTRASSEASTSKCGCLQFAPDQVIRI